MNADDFLNSDLLSETSADPLNFAALQAERTSKKDYRAAYAYINITSYSQRTVLHECPRSFQIMKVPAPDVEPGPNTASRYDASATVNVHFLFGHSVGAGIQTYLVTRDKNKALFAAILSWKADLDVELPKKSKSSLYAFLAVEKFIHWWEVESKLADEWEVATMNDRPATEITFLLDTENGYYHVGHIDIVLRHKSDGRLMVVELKTTGFKLVDEASYGNSDQSLGYSLILDKIAESLDTTSTFEVLYLVYSTPERKLIPLPFTKSRTDRMEWLQDLLLDHSTIATYKKLSFFPKRGESCFSFSRRCPHYGTCDMRSVRKTNFKEFSLERDSLPEPVDFIFKLSDLTKAALRASTPTT